jgi:hypothetical protein
MAGGAETPNIAALPAIARLGACESARGPDADRRVKLLIQFAVEGSHSGAYSHAGARSILRHMQEGNVGRQESLLAAVTDLSSAGLVLERERRRIRHFDGRGFIRGGEGR